MGHVTVLDQWCGAVWDNGRYVGTRRFRVRGQRTPEVNKVALTALKYFNALIASINALTLTALVKSERKLVLLIIRSFKFVLLP